MTCEKCCGAVVFTRVNNEIKYLLVQSLGGIYGFPKGHCEGNETETETAIREIYEEVKIAPRIIDGFRATEEYFLPSKADTSKTVVYFLAEYSNQDAIIQEAEVMSAPVVSYEEAISLLQFDSKRRILEEANDFLTRK